MAYARAMQYTDMERKSLVRSTLSSRTYSRLGECHCECEPVSGKFPDIRIHLRMQTHAMVIDLAHIFSTQQL